MWSRPYPLSKLSPRWLILIGMIGFLIQPSGLLGVGIAADWVAYLENDEDGPGLDGTGILARIVELQDEFALLP